MLSCVALLLLGCLSCAEAIRGDAVDDLSFNEQLVNRAERISQETCLPDIHAVLREMTATMTEQRIQLQATMDRLKDSESLTKALQVDLQQTQKEQSSTQQELRQTQQELQRTQQEVRAAMERLTDSDRLIKASVETIEARSNATQHEVNILQKHNEVSRVSFSACLLASGSGYTGPYNVDTILTYKHVLTNVGNGYNPDTGFFVAPVKGVYQFNIFIYGHGGKSASHASAAKLYRNGQRILSAWAQQPTDTAAASNGASLLLEAGGVVYVKLWDNKRMYDDGANYNTFSGHLLFTM